jgi:hypothetical protein
LADARDKRDKERLQLRNDIDPGALRQQTKLIATSGSGNTFVAIAEEFIEKNFARKVARIKRSRKRAGNSPSSNR